MNTVTDRSSSPSIRVTATPPLSFSASPVSWSVSGAGSRWYDPITGRWLSNDPIGISGGLNQYCPFADAPTMNADPFGETDIGLYDQGEVGDKATGRMSASDFASCLKARHATPIGINRPSSIIIKVREMAKRNDITRIYLADHGCETGMTMGTQPIKAEHVAGLSEIVGQDALLDLFACNVGLNPNYMLSLAKSSGLTVIANTGEIDRNASQGTHVRRGVTYSVSPAGSYSIMSHDLGNNAEALIYFESQLRKAGLSRK